MAESPYRIFFDTSVYIAALLSPNGAGGELVRLAEVGTVRMVVSEEVLIESDRVLIAKFPHLIQPSRKLWHNLKPEIADLPPAPDLKPFLNALPKGDAAILCAAQAAKVSVFVTWNTRDFMAPGIAGLVNFPILVPADTLKHFRAWIDPFLEGPLF
jgi:predicted nucleic acid-binding protein